jgi:hypothetical protein
VIHPFASLKAISGLQMKTTTVIATVKITQKTSKLCEKWQKK